MLHLEPPDGDCLFPHDRVAIHSSVLRVRAGPVVRLRPRLRRLHGAVSRDARDRTRPPQVLRSARTGLRSSARPRQPCWPVSDAGRGPAVTICWRDQETEAAVPYRLQRGKRHGSVRGGSVRGGLEVAAAAGSAPRSRRSLGAVPAPAAKLIRHARLAPLRAAIRFARVWFEPAWRARLVGLPSD